MQNEQLKKDAIQIYNELLEARAVMVRQQQELNDIYNSTCWKLTKPYRLIGITVKKIFKNVCSYCTFGVMALKKIFQWIRKYGLDEGLKVTRTHIGLKMEQKAKKEEWNKLADDDAEWREFEEWLDKTTYSFIDIFSVPMGWNTKLFQRFQHISLNVGKIGGIAVYGAHPNVDCDVQLYKFVSPKLCIVNLDNLAIKHKLFEILDRRKEFKYIRIQSIDLATTITEIQEYIYKGYYIVYEYIDELTPQITGNIPEFVYARHEFLLKNLRVVVLATSDKLYKQALAIRGSHVNLSISTNGVDYEYWKADKDQFEMPCELKEIVEQGKIIVGYHGALAKWIDYRALKNIAQSEKYILLLIGFEHDESLKESGILNIKNVYYLGPKPYGELVKYAVWYDIAILPFMLNEITLSVSPVKIFEYMALQKPIVSSALPECKKYKSCIIADSAEDYSTKVEEAYGLRNNREYLDILASEALKNTWESITQKTVDLVYRCKEYEQTFFGEKSEKCVPDVVNHNLDIQEKDAYINEVLDVSSNKKSVYYKPITEKVYQRKKGDCKVIAYYLTQFHPDSHNELWWGKGVTEWNNVARAVPQYIEHYQPRIPGELGYYDLRIEEVMKRQAELAQMYGVYGFSFYYYWFNGERLLEQPLEMFLKNKDIKIPFALCWANENWTKRFDGTNEDILMKQPNTIESYKNVIHDMVRFLEDERYIEIKGKCLE